MGKATGIFLILAGIGTAALILPKVDTDAERQLADVVRVARGSAPPSVPAAVPAATEPASSSIRLKSSVSTGVGQPSNGERGLSSRGDQERAVASPQPPPQVALRKDVAAVAPPVLVTPPQPVVRNAAPMRTDDAQARQALARDIQKELKRVGCYDGEISGEWNTATRRAMGQFISRLNAALPSDEPDHILRAMVQGYPGNACGRGTPSAIVAQAGATKSSKSADHSHVRDIAVARPTVPKPAWEASVAVVQAPSAAPSHPLPTEGRMAMGGPIAPPTASTVTGSLHAPELRSVTPSAGNGISVSAATAGVMPPPEIALPGTIAALSGDTHKAEAGVRTVSSTRSDDMAAAERRARQRDRERREAAAAPQPFPQAYRLGSTPSPRYYASESYSDRSTFTQRFFARQKTGFDSR